MLLIVKKQSLDNQYVMKFRKCVMEGAGYGVEMGEFL